MFENTFCKLWHADCLLIVQTRSGFLTVFYRIAIEISVYQNESCVNDIYARAYLWPQSKGWMQAHERTFNLCSEATNMLYLPS